MPKPLFLRLYLFLFLLLTGATQVLAQADPLESHWYNEDKTAKIQIYKAKDGKYYGKIVWLKVPDRDGKPKVDARNPDAAKRNQPIVGLVILKGFVKEKEGVYEDGTIYDPKNGKTYSCIIKRDGNKLDVRGYVGISMIGRSTSWIKAD